MGRDVAWVRSLNVWRKIGKPSAPAGTGASVLCASYTKAKLIV